MSKHCVDTVFEDVQYPDSNLSTNKKILTDIYKKSNFEDFFNDFIFCLQCCITHKEKSANVVRTLDFVADFAVSFSFGLEEEESCPLLEGIFNFIFENHDIDLQVVKLRICQLMNRILDKMGHDATVLEETYNKIAESMLIRLQDTMSCVRTQAVYALHRLQNPNDPNCDIIQAFMYHLTQDPSHEVRRAVIQKIAVNKMTLSSILTCINDIKDIVRKEAYAVINRFLIRQFTIKQRQLILENGLGDRSDVIRNFFIDVLVPNWLKYFNNDYFEFLECIHAEKIPELTLKLLKLLFTKQSPVILESNLKNMGIVNQKVPIEKLNVSRAIFWRAMAEHVKPTDEDDKLENVFEQVLPDLTFFCNYIREYYDSETSSAALAVENEPEPGGDSQQKSTTLHVADEAVLVHLLQMCKAYDLADEMGRRNLQQLCVDLLHSNKVTMVGVKVLANVLDYAIPDVRTKLDVMVEIITDLREPLLDSVYIPNLLLIEAEEKKKELSEKIHELETELAIALELGDIETIEEINDKKVSLSNELDAINTAWPDEPGRFINNDTNTLEKCLTIVLEIMKTVKIQRMDSTLYSLMQNFVLPILISEGDKEEHAVVKNLALSAFSIFCLLDNKLAKEHFHVICLSLAVDYLRETALKCVFDFLRFYGLSYFDIKEPDQEWEGSMEEDDMENKNLVTLFVSLLGNEVDEIKRITVLGLSRLLLTGKVKSPRLVSKLILMWFNPDYKSDSYIRQCLGVFFRIFAICSSHAPQLLLQAFLPTVKKVFSADVDDSLLEIDVCKVANLLVDLTRPNINKHVPQDQCIHNQLAIKLCEEVLSEEYDALNTAVFLKLLNQLELNYNLTTDISIIAALTSRITKALAKRDKHLQRLVIKFETTLQAQLDKNKTVSTIDNTLPAEMSLKSIESNKSNFSKILLGMRDDTDSENENTSEDEENSQNESINNLIGEEDVIIQGSPENSDNESDAESPDVKSKNSNFKLPTIPLVRLPYKTPIKNEGMNTKTAVKRSNVVSVEDSSKISAKKPSPLKRIKTPAKNAKTPAKNTKTPAKNAKTPAKNAKTPAKNAKTPANNVKIPAKNHDEAEKTPAKYATEDQMVSDRVSRSSKKRKI